MKMDEAATNKKKSKNIRVRRYQIQIIVETMERNPCLNEYKAYTFTYTAAQRSEDWEKLAQKLNSSGGAIKCVKVWQKCWTDKKGEVKKKNNIIKAARLKAGDGNITEEMKLTPLEERIMLLISPDTAEELGVDERESRTKPKEPELVIPKVEECPNLSVNGSSNPIATSQSFSQESYYMESEVVPKMEECPDLPTNESSISISQSFSQESNHIDSEVVPKMEECSDLPANGNSNLISTSQSFSQESNHIDSEEHLSSDTTSCLPGTEESHQAQSLPCQSNTPLDKIISFFRRAQAKRKVEESPALPANGSPNTITTSQPFVQESHHIDIEEYLQTDTPSCMPNIEESRQHESSRPVPTSSQTKPTEVRPQLKRDRIRPIVLKSDNAQKLINSQAEMVATLARCAEALEKRNEIHERALEIERQKVDVKERLLKLKQDKADAFIGILSILKHKIG